MVVFAEREAGAQNGNGTEPAQHEDFLRSEPKPVPQKKNVPQKSSPVPQKNEPKEPEPPPVLRDESGLIDDDDLDEDFQDIKPLAGWRVEQRFYTKKDGTVMLYWNYRSKTPLYINGERKIKYRKGGKKVWQAKPTKKRMK